MGADFRVLVKAIAPSWKMASGFAIYPRRERLTAAREECADETATAFLGKRPAVWSVDGCSSSPLLTRREFAKWCGPPGTGAALSWGWERAMVVNLGEVGHLGKAGRRIQAAATEALVTRDCVRTRKILIAFWIEWSIMRKVHCAQEEDLQKEQG